MKKTKFIHSFWAIIAIGILIGITAYSIFGGRKSRDIIGTWVTDTNGIESGFQCSSSGIAASIRNSTTQYSKWRISHNNLILQGKRFENRRVHEISDTLTITKLNPKNLVVTYNNQQTSYKKIR